MLQFTQGDNAVLQLTAQDGNGNPVNITGASFSSQVNGPNGVIAVFGNSKHTIVDAATGQYTLTLNTTDTASCGLGNNKELITTITQSTLPVTYRSGLGFLNVLPPVPLQ